jgi:hypothetical protein
MGWALLQMRVTTKTLRVTGGKLLGSGLQDLHWLVELMHFYSQFVLGFGLQLQDSVCSLVALFHFC